MNCEIVPGGGSARSNDPSAVIGKNDIWFGNKTNIREASTEKVRVAPVGCCSLAFEQARSCQQHRARTCRINCVPHLIASAEPFLQLRIAVLQVVVGGKPQLRNDDDVR